MLKITTEKKKWTYNTFRGPLSQGWIDGRYWSSALICHANQSNGYYIILIQGLYWNHVTKSYQVGCIDKSRNIPGLKQHNIHGQTNPTNEITTLESSDMVQVGTSPKANRSDLSYSVSPGIVIHEKCYMSNCI